MGGRGGSLGDDLGVGLELGEGAEAVPRDDLGLGLVLGEARRQSLV